MKRHVYMSLVLTILVPVAACAVFEQGSRYAKTGRISDLLIEPTLDIGGDPPDQFTGQAFRTRWSDYYDVDGHGYFDVPVIVVEEALFTPSVAVTQLGFVLTKADWFPGMARYSAPLVRSVAMVVAVPYAASICLSISGVVVADPVIHDLPVLVVGRPVAAVGSLLRGDDRSLPRPGTPTEDASAVVAEP